MTLARPDYVAHFTKAEVLSGLAVELNPKFAASLVWQHFSPMELASKGNGELILNYKAATALGDLRNMWKRPMIIHSAYRDPIYNRKVGGATNSLHMQGRAFDVGTEGWATAKVVSFIYMATKAGFTGFGWYDTFMHIDTGPHRTWEVGSVALGEQDDTGEMPA